MYKSFKVRNFRCFQDLNLDSLARVNLIAGVNNIGKTALLEALFIHCGTKNPGLSLRVNAFRGIETVKFELTQWVEETPWNTIFNQFDISKIIELKGEDTIAGSRSIKLKVLHEPSQLNKLAKYISIYSKDESKSTLSSSEISRVLELEYKDNKIQESHYMIIDREGIRAVPITPPPPFPAFFQADRIRIPFKEEAERFGNLEIQGKQDVLLNVLKIIEKRLDRLTVVVVAGEPIIHGDIGIGRLMPLPLMGGGMVRLTTFVLHIVNAPKGVVLIDEIENGLHHSVMKNVWKAIGSVAREFNTQVFATTHSRECIIAAHRAFSESDIYDFHLHRLERINSSIVSITYDKETLEAAIETGLEVR